MGSSACLALGATVLFVLVSRWRWNIVESVSVLESMTCNLFVAVAARVAELLFTLTAVIQGHTTQEC